METMEAVFELRLVIKDRNVEQKLEKSSISGMNDELVVNVLKSIMGTKKKVVDTIDRFLAGRDLQASDQQQVDENVDQTAADEADLPEEK